MKMREIFLSKPQIKALTNGKSIVLSRGGQKILLGSKDKQRKEQEAKQKAEKIKALERTLKALKATGVKIDCTHPGCKRTFDRKRSLGQHVRVAHQGHRTPIMKKWDARKEARIAANAS